MTPTVSQRVYVSGFEHHSFYSPANYKAQLEKRGFKSFSDNKYGGTGARGGKAPDTRFARQATDYREIQDDDPYAGLFGERKTVERARVKEWQAQFERENAHVELPYDRDSFATRMMPNWFVRFTCRMRENGGFDVTYLLFYVALILCTIALFYMGSNRMRGEEEDIRHLR